VRSESTGLQFWEFLVSSVLRDAAVPSDSRVDELIDWLTRLFGAADFSISVASADASFRRYFRIARHGETWVAMDAPPGKEDVSPYVRIADMLVSVGVNAPHVLERDVARGFVLSSDLGSRTYLTALDEGTAPEPLYQDAITALVTIQSGGAVHLHSLPPYDDALLRREMELFPDWFCDRHLGLALTAQDRAGMAAVFDTLAAEALSQPRVFVHRDYHSRNLMVCDERHGGNPGILDFQDAVAGPVSYDLVSLLRDCYVAWPIERVHAWALEFRDEGAAAGIVVGASREQFIRWFDLMGVQRHLKAIGIFARLWHRDGKRGYLKDIPRTLRYVKAVSGHYRELAPLGRLIATHVEPALDRMGASADT
jgi:N-acetylmuramate 1-kinase